MAMNPIFENKTNLDDEVIDHIVSLSIKKNKKQQRYRKSMLFIGIVGIILGVVYGYNGLKIMHAATIITSIALIVLGVYCLINFFSYSIQKEIDEYKKRMEKTLKMTRSFQIYKDSIVETAGRSRGEYSPSQVAAIEEFGHYYLLKYENGYLILDKNGFTKGTAEDFKAYLEERKMVV